MDIPSESMFISAQDFAGRRVLVHYGDLASQQCVDVHVTPNGKVDGKPSGKDYCQLGMEPGSAVAATLGAD